MAIKFTNFAYSTLAVGIGSGDTTVAVAGGHGARFPTLGVGDYFYATLENSGGTREIIKVTARAVDSLTVVRAQDNTTAVAWLAGDSIALRLNAKAIEEAVVGTLLGSNNLSDVANVATSRTNLGAAASGLATASGLTMTTGTILGRTTASTGAIEEKTPAQVRDMLGSNPTIQPITASVAANALTATLNATNLDFRSATLGSGTVVTRTVSAAISVVTPSSATLGTVNAVASRIAVLAIDNAGTVELAVVNMRGGVNLDETTLISTTAISAGATSSSVIYSTTARSNVAFRVVGFIESTQATAGTWVTAPSTIQGAGGQAFTAMSSLGYGQVWSVGVTRTSGTTYYNTTAKPIFLIATITSNASAMSTSIAINGGSSILFVQTASAAAAVAAGSIIIPAWASYVLTDAGSITSRVTSELR